MPLSEVTKDGVTLASTTDSEEQLRAALGEESAEEKPEQPTSEAEAEPEAEGDEPEAEEEAEEAEIEDDAAGESEEEEEEEESSEDESKKPKSRYQQRIDELTRERYEAQREAEKVREDLDRLRREMEALKQPEPAESKAETTPEAKPKPEDFDTYEEFAEALTDWKFDQRTKAERDQAIQEAQQRQQAEIQQQWIQKIEAAQSKHEDWDQVTSNPNVPVSPPMEAAMMSSDDGAEILYELMKNPDEAHRIAQLPPARALLEMGKIEARLNAVPSPSKQKPKVSKAKPPIKPVGSGDTKSTKNPSDMSMKEFYRWRGDK